MVQDLQTNNPPVDRFLKSQEYALHKGGNPKGPSIRAMLQWRGEQGSRREEGDSLRGRKKTDIVSVSAIEDLFSVLQ